MGCLKELSLVLIVGCLAVLAADKTSSDEPRVISDQDVRLLINPFAFLQTKTTTPKPERPTTIVVKPPYHYPYYPHYPHYPEYPSDDYYPHRPPHPPHPTHPSYPTHPTPPGHPSIRPTQPEEPPTAHPHPPVYPTHPPVYPTHPPMYPHHPPLYPQHPPMYPQHPPMYPYYPPQYSQPPFGYYPWMFPGGQPPYIVVVHPPTKKPTLPELPDLPDLPNVPDVPNGTDVPKVPDVPGTGNKVYRYQTQRRPAYQYVQSGRMFDELQVSQEDASEDQQQPQQQENGNDDEMLGRNIKLDGVSITADSAEDSDTIAVDTKDIKLPFGIHLATHPATGRKVKDQEALIYLRNFKKGRQLKEAETA